jgi:hypothetical protein
MLLEHHNRHEIGTRACRREGERGEERRGEERRNGRGLRNERIMKRGIKTVGLMHHALG